MGQKRSVGTKRRGSGGIQRLVVKDSFHQDICRAFISPPKVNRNKRSINHLTPRTSCICQHGANRIGPEALLEELCEMLEESVSGPFDGEFPIQAFRKDEIFSGRDDEGHQHFYSLNARVRRLGVRVLLSAGAPESSQESPERRRELDGQDGVAVFRPDPLELVWVLELGQSAEGGAKHVEDGRVAGEDPAGVPGGDLGGLDHVVEDEVEVDMVGGLAREFAEQPAADEPVEPPGAEGGVLGRVLFSRAQDRKQGSPAQRMQPLDLAREELRELLGHECRPELAEVPVEVRIGGLGHQRCPAEGVDEAREGIDEGDDELARRLDLFALCHGLVCPEMDLNGIDVLRNDPQRLFTQGPQVLPVHSHLFGPLGQKSFLPLFLQQQVLPRHFFARERPRMRDVAERDDVVRDAVADDVNLAQGYGAAQPRVRALLLHLAEAAANEDGQCVDEEPDEVAVGGKRGELGVGGMERRQALLHYDFKGLV